jgi:hypothetical protein
MSAGCQLELPDDRTDVGVLSACTQQQSTCLTHCCVNAALELPTLESIATLNHAAVLMCDTLSAASRVADRVCAYAAGPASESAYYCDAHFDRGPVRAYRRRRRQPQKGTQSYSGLSYLGLGLEQASCTLFNDQAYM